MTFGVLILNSFLWYQLSLGFFDRPTIWFLFIIFNQIYLAFGLLFVYTFAKMRVVEDELKEIKYIISKKRK